MLRVLWPVGVILGVVFAAVLFGLPLAQNALSQPTGADIGEIPAPQETAPAEEGAPQAEEEATPTEVATTPTPASVTYVVQAGDTLFGIAVQHGVSLEDLMAANPQVDPYRLQDDEVLTIPSWTRVTDNADWVPVIQDFDGVEMALVPAGCFMMGSEDGETTNGPSTRSVLTSHSGLMCMRSQTGSSPIF